MIETMISSGKVEGVFDGRDFMSHYALQRETVRYDIVSKFEVDKNGVIVLNCPNCGASIPLEQKESMGKCKFCGTAYTILRKILDLK
jgi:exosome complex RNA-binding protein Csl4